MDAGGSSELPLPTAHGGTDTTVPILRRDLTIAALLGLVSVVWSGLGSWVPSIWVDEAASITATRRSWAELWRLLGNIDAVHGLYYAGLKLWFTIIATGPVTLRLPSLLAMGGVVASTYLLARRFMRPPVAAVAASVCALLPRATWMAIEGRSWAFSALAAVVATLLLVDWVSTARRRLLFGYAVAIAIGITLGRMWRNMIRQRLSPRTRADSMYGRVDCVITALRIIRMSVGENRTTRMTTVTQ